MSITALEMRLWSINGDLLAATAVNSFGLSAMVRNSHKRYFELVAPDINISESTLFVDLRHIYSLRHVAKRSSGCYRSFQWNNCSVGDVVPIGY